MYKRTGKMYRGKRNMYIVIGKTQPKERVICIGKEYEYRKGKIQ